MSTSTIQWLFLLSLIGIVLVVTLRHTPAMDAELTQVRRLDTPSHSARSSSLRAMKSVLSAAKVFRVPQETLHVSKPTWWLESRFHFSFADYWDEARSSFGALRVVNDDLVKARSGFGAHPHRDMEIFSYIVDGNLTHADSMGMRETLGRGAVQYMSAGTGVRHSEMNDGDETCRFLQIWIQPDKRGHTPQYGSSRYEKSDRHNKLLQILGGTQEPPAWKAAHAPNCIRLHQDANVYVSECDPGVSLEVDLGAKRQVYAVCIEGGMTVNGVELRTRDAAKVLTPDSETTSSLQFTAGQEGAHFLMVEMAQP